MNCLCSVIHCSWCGKTFTMMPSTQLSFCLLIVLLLSPAPDESPTILTVTPHTTTSVLICWQVRERDFPLYFSCAFPSTVCNNRAGGHSMYLKHMFSKSPLNYHFKKPQASGLHLYPFRWQKGERTGSTQFIHDLLGGISQIWSLNLSKCLRWQSKDVFPPDSNVHVHNLQLHVVAE